MGGAQLPHRTLFTQRRPIGQAHHSAQLHQRLIELSRCLPGKDGQQPLPHSVFCILTANVAPIPQNAGDHPQNIAVHRRSRKAKGDGGDRPGGIIAHAGQGANGIIVRWKFSAIVRHDLTGCLLQIPGTIIVAQPLPQLHQRVLRHLSQCLGRGQRSHKALKITDHCRHTGLLQHNLRHPDPVGAVIRPPRQHPRIFLIPFQKRKYRPFQFAFLCVHAHSPFTILGLL